MASRRRARCLKRQGYLAEWRSERCHTTSLGQHCHSAAHSSDKRPVSYWPAQSGAHLAFGDDFYRAGALLPEDDSLRILMLEG